MKIYFYNKKTFEYIGQGDAQKDILESKKQNKDIYMFPPNCTTIEPDYSLNKNEVLIFSENKWEVKKDYRGTKLYNINNRSIKIIDKIDDIPKNYIDYTTLEPPNGKYIFQNGEWVVDEQKEKEIEDKIYLQKIINKKMNEIIIQELITDKIISKSGKILKNDIEDLNKDIFEMINDLGQK